jgi:SpoVK/Ycf46/Vps4 family AAA+-type ATPase
MFQHDQVFTRTAVAKQSLEACDKIFQKQILFDTIEKYKNLRETFFWTKQQKRLLEKDSKRVLFTSNYGTGKTLVMRAKAMQLARKRQLFYFSKKQAEQGNLMNSRETYLEATKMQLGNKELFYLKNQTNRANLIDPGKTFIIFFTKPDALLFHSIHQEFEELKDHVEAFCLQGQLLYFMVFLKEYLSLPYQELSS